MTVAEAHQTGSFTLRDDELPDEVARLRRRVRAFVEEQVIPREEELHRATEDGEFEAMRSLQDRAKREGLWALGLPTELGGGGLSFLHYAFINEIIGRSEPAQEALGTLQTQDALMLARFGSEEQQRRWLKPLVNGEFLPSVGMTEPEVAGSDPRQVRTTARLDRAEWVIDGHKWFTSHADRAGFITVLARTDEDSERPEYSMLIVPTESRGVSIARVLRCMGDRAGGHCEVWLRDARVGENSLLGERGDGLRIAQTRLGPGRIFHCMRWLGQAQRAFELMCERAKERHAFGSPLAEKGQVQDMIAESVGDIQAARLLTLDAARCLDRDRDAAVAVSVIKFYGARMLHNVIDRAIQIHGALGVTSDAPLEWMYRRAREARILDGPDEVHRMHVARRVLRDPAAVPWA